MKTTERKLYRYKTTKTEKEDYWQAFCSLYLQPDPILICQFGLIHAILANLSSVDRKTYALSRIRLAESYAKFYWYCVNILKIHHCQPGCPEPDFVHEILRWTEGAGYSDTSEFNRMQATASVNREILDDLLFAMYSCMGKLPFTFSREGHSLTLNPYFYEFLTQNRDALLTLNFILYVRQMVTFNPDYSFVELMLDMDLNAGLSLHADYRYFFDVYPPRFLRYQLDLSDCRDYFQEFLSYQADSAEEAALMDKLRNIDLTEIPVRKYRPVPVAKSAPVIRNGIRVIERDPKISANALLRAEFTCEVDPDHLTFLRKKDHRPYTKPFHLIPMAYSRQFEYSLDVEANIISLCPMCYEKIMYGNDTETALRDLYDLRRGQLLKCGIEISFDRLLTMYGLQARHVSQSAAEDRLT